MIPSLLARPSAAHPRAGGENVLHDRPPRRARGSSPRGRGKRLRPSCRGSRQRLIPARAGKTHRPRTARRRRWAHPRAGGENVQQLPSRIMSVGSSPRGRGKPRMVTGSPPRLSAHPRAGGENSSRAVRPFASTGSSPRGRGKPCRRRVSRPVGGLIPARAGKTAGLEVIHAGCPAHPRAGGENPALFGGPGAMGGSSPRGRGKRQRRKGPRNPLRLIPARAGKTSPGLS